jgi:hypothetical protein
MFKVPGTKSIYEDVHKVAKFRRILPPNSGEPGHGGTGRSEALLQFYAQHGGQRTVAIKDIADIK